MFRYLFTEEKYVKGSWKIKNICTFLLVSVSVFLYSDILTDGWTIKNTCIFYSQTRFNVVKINPQSSIIQILNVYTGLCECDMKTNNNMCNKLSFVKAGGERDWFPRHWVPTRDSFTAEHPVRRFGEGRPDEGSSNF